MPDIDTEYTVINKSRNRTVARRVRLASSSATRRKGLLAVSCLDEDSGLWIVPCEAIHTFGMRIPIDAVFLDRQSRIKKINSTLSAGRIAVCFKAYSVLELASGIVDKSGTEVGDHLAFLEREVRGQ